METPLMRRAGLSRFSLALAAVFLAGLALRLVNLHDVSHDILRRYPLLDEGLYYSTGLRMAAGETIPGPYWRPPGLYFVLAAILKTAGAGPFVPRLVQVLLSALSVLLVWDLGRLHFSRRTALLGALFLALNGVVIAAATDIKDTTWTLFLDLAVLSALTRAARRRSLAWAVAAGLAAGASVLFRPLLLLFVPVATAWLLFRARRPRRFALAAVFLAGVVTLILPVAIRNNANGGPFVLVSTNGGMNFFIGNNPDYRATVTARPGNQWDEAVLEPARRAGFDHEGPDRDRWYFRSGLDFLAHHPREGLALLLRKLALYFNGHEIPRDRDVYVEASRSRLLGALIGSGWPAWPAGVLVPLALVGLLEGRRRFRRHALLVLFLAVQAVGVALFFVSSRYRIPAVPVISLFAAAGTLRLVALARGGPARRAIPVFAGFAAALVLLNLPAFETHQSLAAEREFFLGNAFANERRYDDAKAAYRRAAALDTTDARPLRGLADQLEAEGDDVSAEPLRRKVITIGPYSARDRDRLVTLLMRRGRRHDAATALADDIAATSSRDRQAEGHFKLGVLLYDEDRPAEAVEEFKRARDIDPERCARSVLRWGREIRARIAPADTAARSGFWRDLADVTDGTEW